jgi:hypothetical protein
MHASQHWLAIGDIPQGKSQVLFAGGGIGEDM